MCRKRYLFCSFLLLIHSIISASMAFAFSWEVHPGLITSCVYSDNYFGVPYSQNPQSDTTYNIGPSLDFKIATESIAFNFSGYITKDYHKRNTNDDSDEEFLQTGLNLTDKTQMMNLNYSYRRTTERQTLDQSWGEYTYHTGLVEYRKSFSDSDSINLRYRIEQEFAPDDPVTSVSNDLNSNTGEVLLELMPTQKNALNLSAKVEDFKYKSYLRDNILTIVSDATWMYDLLQNLKCGLEAANTSNNPSRNPNSDIYEGFFNAEYRLTQYITLFAKAGYSWLKQETEGTKGVSAGELRIERLTDSDHFTLSGSRDYSYDYTTGSTYGMYLITSGNFSWEHTFIRKISLIANGEITRRKPESDLQNGTTDKSAGLTLRYTPVRWLTINGTYNYLLTEYTEINIENENTDTRRENRYMIDIEARY